jgi:hypothetical protein
MSVFLFGSGSGEVSDELLEEVETVLVEAGEEECSLVRYNDPASGPRYWFSGPNRGAPFDERMARRVFAALEAAGIQLPQR